jgi:transketolase
MTLANIDDLKKMANQIRIDTINQVYQAKSGHPGGSMSAADLLAALYFYKLNIKPELPQWEDRDRFILSKGHASPAYYSALARKGYFNVDRLKNFRSVNDYLEGAPSMKLAGVDMSAGPLGQGLSVAVGMALGGRLSDKQYKTYCMVGDGEIQEGQIWEALMTAAKYQLGNLVGILDNNHIQMCGTNECVMPLGDIPAKLIAFGWKVINIDGHDMSRIVEALNQIDNNPVGTPTMIIANTVKGKGVSFMEDTHKWHGAVPTDEQYAAAMKELGGGFNE